MRQGLIRYHSTRQGRVCVAHVGHPLQRAEQARVRLAALGPSGGTLIGAEATNPFPSVSSLESRGYCVVASDRFTSAWVAERAVVSPAVGRHRVNNSASIGSHPEWPTGTGVAERQTEHDSRSIRSHARTTGSGARTKISSQSFQHGVVATDWPMGGKATWVPQGLSVRGLESAGDATGRDSPNPRNPGAAAAR
jgi:hypothetical protein